MWGWFGGQQTQKQKDAPKKAILDLRTQLDMLSKREKYLESQIAEQEAIARANVTKNKVMARTALKRKKAHEASLEQTTNQVAMLENQIYSIEAANINQETLKAVQAANSAMKTIHQGMTIDKVDAVMEDTTEQKALTEEIGNAFAAHSGLQDVDEDELNEELAGLEQEQLDEQLLKTGPTPVLPNAVRTEPKGKAPAIVEEEDEEEELRKLQAEMAM